MPVRPLIEKTPPMAMVISADKIGADRIERKGDIDIGALERPGSPASGNGGLSASASEWRIASTRAATRAFSSSVSPGSATKVPVDWSLAILAASASMLPGVSIR